MGALAPAAMPYWFGIEPLGALTLGSHRHLGAVAAAPALPRLAPILPEGRLSHGFLVYDGGQS
jgi:hypothetical protein